MFILITYFNNLVPDHSSCMAPVVETGNNGIETLVLNQCDNKTKAKILKDMMSDEIFK